MCLTCRSKVEDIRANGRQRMECINSACSRMHVSTGIGVLPLELLSTHIHTMEHVGGSGHVFVDVIDDVTSRC